MADGRENNGRENNGRENRGASYMNNYDDDYNSNTYASDSGGGDNCCTKCAQHTVFWVNLFLALAGIAIIMVGVFAYQSTSMADFGMAEAMLYVVIILGVVIILVGVLGCCASTVQSLWLIVPYMVLLVLGIILEIVVVALSFNQGYMRSYLKDQWGDLTAAQQADVEADLDCCGWDGPTVDHPCYGVGTTTTAAPLASMAAVGGCYEAAKDIIMDFQYILGGVALFLIVYQMVMLGCSGKLCCDVKRGKAA